MIRWKKLRLIFKKSKVNGKNFWRKMRFLPSYILIPLLLANSSTGYVQTPYKQSVVTAPYQVSFYRNRNRRWKIAFLTQNLDIFTILGFSTKVWYFLWELNIWTRIRFVHVNWIFRQKKMIFSMKNEYFYENWIFIYLNRITLHIWKCKPWILLDPRSISSISISLFCL